MFSFEPTPRVSKIELSYFKPVEAVTVYSTRLLGTIWAKWYHAQENCGHIFLIINLIVLSEAENMSQKEKNDTFPHKEWGISIIII